MNDEEKKIYEETKKKREEIEKTPLRLKQLEQENEALKAKLSQQDGEVRLKLSQQDEAIDDIVISLLGGDVIV